MAESSVPAEGYKSPKALAESMAKRYNQIRAAFPTSEIEEIFSLILDNRYKLLGNIVPNSGRSEIVAKSSKSLSLLTLLTLISETKDAIEEMQTDDELYYSVIEQIHRTITKEVPKLNEPNFDEYSAKAFHFIHGG